jgi:hypothetical protein
MRHLWFAALLLTAPVLHAQDFDFYARGPYNAAVPRPETLLGYRVGTQHTMYHQQQQVFDRMIAAAPERVRTEVIGQTVEGKVMRLLIISSPGNLARLDDLRADLERLDDPRRTSAAEAKAIAGRNPGVVLLTHSVHGNEPAGFEASMQTVYQLLASNEPATLDILKHVVILINPSQNPDGHERFAAWSNSVAVGSDDPAALEREEPWTIAGRYNHYRFDMNRDMLAQSQPEARALAGVMRKWNPNVVVDLHSTVQQYFFPPVTQAINPNLGALTLKWFETLGRGNAAAFDAYSWQYFVRDEFDFFYPGYIDEWPTLRGSTGMTYETDGGPPLRLRKDDGSVTTFEMGIAHHFVAALATLGTTAANTSARLLDAWQFHADGMASAKAAPVKRIVFSSPDADRARWLAHRLAEEGIEVTHTTAAFSALKASSFYGPTTGPATKQMFPAGAYVVDLTQPQAKLATALLEPRAAFDTAFVKKEVAKYERNRRRGEDASRENYTFYDVTAWSLPYAQGLDAWTVEDAGPVTGDVVQANATLPVGRVSGRAQSAYLFSPETEGATRLAMQLLAEGTRVAVASQPLVADHVTYPRGTFVVRVQRNDSLVHARIARLAASSGVQVAAVRSAFADTGAVGTGSPSVDVVRAPRILLLGGDGVNQTAFGATWHYLEAELGQRVTPITARGLGRVDMGAYNVLIIPDGNPTRIADGLGEANLRKVAQWVRDGGALITTGESSLIGSRRGLELSTVKALGDDDKKSDGKDGRDTTVSSFTSPVPPLVSPEATAGKTPEQLPGAIFRATLDRTHWLTYGYDRDELAVFLDGNTFFTPSTKGDNPVAFTRKELTLSGFTWPGNTDRLLKGTVWTAVETVGKGHMILFAADPLFRAFWRGPAKLFTNAILFGPGREAH